MKFTTLVLATVLFSGANAFANCSDMICKVTKKNGSKVDLDIGLCALGTSPVLFYPDSHGNQVEVPGHDPQHGYLIGGFWFDANTMKLRILDDGGAEVFKLETTMQHGVQKGRVTANLPDLVLSNARVSCPQP